MPSRFEMMPTSWTTISYSLLFHGTAHGAIADGVEGEVALGIERSRIFSVRLLLDVYRSTSCHQLCCGKCYRDYLNHTFPIPINMGTV